MYIHEEITKAVLPLLEKHDLELIDLIGEMNHAAWELSVLNEAGIKELTSRLVNGEQPRRPDIEIPIEYQGFPALEAAFDAGVEACVPYVEMLEAKIKARSNLAPLAWKHHTFDACNSEYDETNGYVIPLYGG